MSKFDRCNFISIAIGIWSFAMTQVFKSERLEAKFGYTIFDKHTIMKAKCPK